MTLETTPAVAAGLASEPYPVTWLAELVANLEPPQRRRGPDTKPRQRKQYRVVR